MKRQSNWLYQWAEFTGLAEENPTQMPLVEICGKHRVLIEYHQGVCAYTSEKICVRVRYGLITVNGKNLMLQALYDRHLVICGEIASIELEGAK